MLADLAAAMPRFSTRLALVALATGCSPAGDVSPGTDTAVSEEPSTGEAPTTGGSGEPTGSSSTGTPAVCGDGVVDPGEACDLGPDNSDARACTDACKLAVCGDGFVHMDVEQCDFGEANDDGGPCTLACTIAACGDGRVHAGVEECDLGLGMNSNTGACTVDCKQATCGDGNVHAGVEACDLGAGNSDDYGGCSKETCQWSDRCGDGIVQPEHEECDAGENNGVDGETGAPCSTECRVHARLVFVTSQTYSGNLGGLDGADLECQLAAQAAGIDGPESFRAWLSDDTGSPLTRFSHGEETKGLPYILRDGQRVADDFDDLVLHGLQRPIDVTEDGQSLVPQEIAWTNTSHTGATHDPDAHCARWSSSGGLLSSRVGMVSPVADALQLWKDKRHWTSFDAYKCSYNWRLYCFEQALP